MRITDIEKNTSYSVSYDEESIHALLDGICDAEDAQCVLTIEKTTRGEDGISRVQYIHYISDDGKNFTRANNQFPALVYIDDKEDESINNPLVKCPVCGRADGILLGWSMLSAGFGGIAENTQDDIQALECGNCGTYVEY